MRRLARFVRLVGVAGVALELYFVARVASLGLLPLRSTAFERTEVVRQLATEHRVAWHQQWAPYADISPNLERAVVASEDDGFMMHGGVDWDALRGAWRRNEAAQDRVVQRIERAEREHRDSADIAPPKIVGGSTITQQLAKNLFLSGERTLPRKGQELLITFALEAFLSKRRILELYLNHAQWGDGIFGAQAAAQHYCGTTAATLTRTQAARLAVMLPRPRYFEARPKSGYLAARARVIVRRMGAARIP